MPAGPVPPADDLWPPAGEGQKCNSPPQSSSRTDQKHMLPSPIKAPLSCTHTDPEELRVHSVFEEGDTVLWALDLSGQPGPPAAPARPFLDLGQGLTDQYVSTAKSPPKHPIAA
ncbi:hypothetical protein AOLI_G00046990 [Acnodon oligacanthus]